MGGEKKMTDVTVTVQTETPDGIQPWEAVLNVTWAGQNGDLSDPVAYDATDAEIRAYAAEAVSTGSVAGIRAARANFSDFVVERFPATTDVSYNRIVVRPKTPFGA
jgi:hypothetical protein